METLTVVHIRGRALEGMDEATAARAYEVLTGKPPTDTAGAPSIVAAASDGNRAAE